MLNEQQKRAYASLLKRAQEAAREAEDRILETMHEVIDKASEMEEEFAELSKEELEKVKAALKADLDAVARYFEEVGEGLEEILIMDAAWLEEKFLELSEKLADPAELELLRLRMLAAMKSREQNNDDSTG